MNRLRALYDRLILPHPVVVLTVFGLLLGLAAVKFGEFRLDASAESLVLEDDRSLEQYRKVHRRFTTSDDFLIVTYTPKRELFSEQGLDHLRALRDELQALDAVGSTNSILNVPLLHSPDLTLDTVDSEIKTIDADNVPPETAREALLNNPLYPNLLISEDAKTTAIQVNLPTPERYFELLQQRNELRDKVAGGKASDAERAQLETVRQTFIDYTGKLGQERDATIATVRTILDRYRDQAEIHLGGVPMIVSDMIRFIQNDLSTFGFGVLAFLLLTLAIIFRQWRWVLIPTLCCGFTVWLMVGFLGWAQWPVTVISANFIALLLIMTLSLTIHLIVRYREFQHDEPEADPKDSLRKTVMAMIKPCFYMAVTTIVAFGSLTFSGIRPVIDFGWMMTLGLTVAFLITFIIFPALLRILPPPLDKSVLSNRIPFTDVFASFTERFGKTVLVGSAAIAILCAVGVSKLTVENSFIDYFKSSTEIHQGMITIDNRLGGTTPLDIVITDEKPPENATTDSDPFASGCDPFAEDCGGEEEYRDTWYTYQKMQKLEKVHNYLDSLPETGKVLSITSTLDILALINQGERLDALELAFVPAAVPDDLQDVLLTPYISEEHDQARFSVRILETMPELRRQALLDRIHSHLTNELDYDEDQVLFAGMTVMYNNMLQSLFDSQIKTIGAVFLAIMAMFLLLFRSFKMALIGIAPNLIAAGSVLGLMGWLGIPLDMMTITVAAITVGIAVDDTIHYLHRFKTEFAKDGDYLATMHRCHRSIGRAMFYTSLTIIAGFSILVLSNFIPTIYFGLFTGFAMFMALLGALTLLPRLIVMVKPFGPGASA
ncbi:MMPL family transporter [Marinobacter sp. M216]|uniref:MMPL family transporter n=1 Tax=Marinobacter albus TaxID=3030833 RepID=A0ABT7HGA0_9GAMM|nr:MULTISPECIES: MMPL family transporter [unclassified Marinobacter]MBW7472830.1 MMPL family transporter [Marinobacter sp. F4218]MDK9559383.1 MMPL family transporter [Marinobacter sp. M216]